MPAAAALPIVKGATAPQTQQLDPAFLQKLQV
jgi:hypothetical protein